MRSNRIVASLLSIVGVLTLSVTAPAEDCGVVPELPPSITYPPSYTCQIGPACDEPTYVSGVGTLVECRWCVSPNVRTLCVTGYGSPPEGELCQVFFQDSGCGELVHSPATLVYNQLLEIWEVQCDYSVIIEKDICCHRAICRIVEDPLGN